MVLIVAAPIQRKGSRYLGTRNNALCTGLRNCAIPHEQVRNLFYWTNNTRPFLYQIRSQCFSNIPALYEKIRRDPVHFPESTTQHSPELKDIILRMLEKDPSKRITLSDIKVHDWVTAGQTFPLPSEEENCRPIQISDEELDNVVKSIPKLDTLILIKTMLKKHSFQNPFQKAARTSQRGVARLEHFRAGRSNSAPGAYHATLQK